MNKGVKTKEKVENAFMDLIKNINQIIELKLAATENFIKMNFSQFSMMIDLENLGHHTFNR